MAKVAPEGAVPPSSAGPQPRRALSSRRVALGLTQGQLAELIGATRTTVWRWEHGIASPAARQRRPLAEALELSVFELADLLGEVSAAAVRELGGERRAVPGEWCTCGRPASVVFTGGSVEVGWCGVSGVAAVTPCRFCAAVEGHREAGGGTGRCPEYRVRSDVMEVT